jgi:acetyl esterase/lipase
MLGKITYYIVLFFTMSVPPIYPQTVIPVYSDNIPNSIPTNEPEVVTNTDMIRIGNISVPALTVFLPEKEKANGTAVLICPGGGYSIVAISHEGYDVAKEFNKIGVTAFVLKYRLPDCNIMTNRETGPLQDALQAMKIIKEGADKWNINPSKIGILGFSAGGHLASTAATKFSQALPGISSNISLRPDFMILLYPVISFSNELTHEGSRTNLIGPSPSPEKIKAFSSDQNVTQQTPPTFLMHAGDDETVKLGNSIAFYEALTSYLSPRRTWIRINQ